MEEVRWITDDLREIHVCMTWKRMMESEVFV